MTDRTWNKSIVDREWKICFQVSKALKETSNSLQVSAMVGKKERTLLPLPSTL